MSDKREPIEPAAPGGEGQPSIAKWIGIGVGAGIGSAAVAAALLYAGSKRPQERQKRKR